MFNKRYFLTLILISFLSFNSWRVFGQVTQPQSIIPKAVSKRAVAIITFENLSSYPENDWVGASFAESLTTKLSKLEGLELYERRQLNKVIAENGLNQKMVSEKHWERAEKLGQTLRLKGVQSLLIGSVAMIGSYENPDTALQINARTVNMKTGEIAKGEATSVQGKFSELFNLQTRLAQQFISILGMETTSEEEQRISEKETESLALYRLYILGLQALDAGKFSEAKKLFYEAYKPTGFPAAREGFAIASELEITTKEKAGVRDELGRIEYAKTAEIDASQSAVGIYYLGRQRLFDGKYDEAIKHYRTFLDYTQNKVLRWKYQAKVGLKCNHIGIFGIHTQYPPVIWDGVVYVADNKSTLYALERSTGNLLWKAEMDSSQPVIIDGTIYVSDQIKGIVYALEAKSGKVIWKSELGVQLGRNSIVSGDMVYVWSNHPINSSEIHNNIYALGRTNGTLKWQYDIGSRDGYSSPITVSDGKIYVLSTASPTYQEAYKDWIWPNTCSLFALDGSNGRLLWESALLIYYSRSDLDRPILIDYAPVLSNGVIYTVAADAKNPRLNERLIGHLYALSSETGAVLWRSQVKCTGARPVVSGDVVYIPSRDGVYVLDAGSGNLKGELRIGKPATIWDISYNILAADDIVCLRPSSGRARCNPPSTEETRDGDSWINVAGEGTIYAFSLDKNVLLWKFQVTAGIHSSFSVSDGIIYFTAEDRNLYALHAKTGLLLWKYELEKSAKTSELSHVSVPLVLNDTVYVNGGNTLYAIGVSGSELTSGPSDLDAQVAIGRALWLKGEIQEAETTLKTIVEEKPNFIGAWLLLGDIYEKLNQTEDAIQSWQKVGKYAYATDEEYIKSSIDHLVKLAGLKWRFKPYPNFVSPATHIIPSTDVIYVEEWNGEFVCILENGTGKLIERHDNARMASDLANGIACIHYNGKLRVLEIETSKTLWEHEIDQWSCPHGAYVLDGILFTVTDDGLSAFYVKTGEMIWRINQKGCIRAVCDGVIYLSRGYITIGGGCIKLLAISTKNGEILWTYKIRQDFNKDKVACSMLLPSNPVSASADIVYLVLYTEEKEESLPIARYGLVFALNKTNGEIIWTFKTDLLEVPNDIQMLIGKDGIVYVNGYNETYALDEKTGAMLWKQPIGFIRIGENIIYGQSRDGFIVMDAQSDKKLWDFKSSEGFYSDYIMSGEVIYVRKQNGILYALEAKTGKPLWKYEAGNATIGAVANGRVYLFMEDGGVSALDITQASEKLYVSSEVVEEPVSSAHAENPMIDRKITPNIITEDELNMLKSEKIIIHEVANPQDELGGLAGNLEILICHDINNDKTELLGITNVFETSDEKALVFVKFDDVPSYTGYEVRMIWRNPEGSIYRTFDQHIPEHPRHGRHYWFWAFIRIKGDVPANMPGEWTVEFQIKTLVKGELTATNHKRISFQIKP